jgi:phospholipid transport system substrate-binding protein
VGLLEFENDNIEVLEFRGDLTARSATVRTQVRLDSGTRVPVNYLLANQNPGWLMLDVKIEGISYVRNFRTEVDLEIRSTSLDAVISRLEEEAGIAADE